MYPDRGPEVNVIYIELTSAWYIASQMNWLNLCKRLITYPNSVSVLISLFLSYEILMSLRIYNEMTIDSTYAGNSVWLSTDLALTQNQNERYLHSLGILGPPWVSLPKIRLTSTAFGRKYWITLRLYICITLNYHFAKCFWWLTHSTSGQQSLTANTLSTSWNEYWAITWHDFSLRL